MLALIPARSGSVRVPDKNVIRVGEHPLLAYAIRSAINSRLFSDVVVATDSQHYANIARHYGATVPGIRPSEISGSFSPDAEWVSWIFRLMPSLKDLTYAFILRPTSPFRTSLTITRAHQEFSDSSFDTLRAVKPVSEHPGKMWVSQGNAIVPLLPFRQHLTPWHSNQLAALFDVYIQDASLEIFTISSFLDTSCITGTSIAPFFSVGHEGFDINTVKDVETMNHLLNTGCANLESIDMNPYAS